ncbi:hypothetical protein Clacol_006839 [Clathrus columnatus]|uniref:Uncharacterized protein n=1 Tax=Clathrus columnatus TaxID=1419009 RepID=A0AAV5AI22_9AGAM|nr:hypothetical protein Clacol_006839 [Clathrus columnatus]
MEFWPTDFRTDNSALQKRRNGKEVYTLIGRDIDVGSLGAATLSFKRNLLEWQTLVQPPREIFPRQIGDSVQMLPPRAPPNPSTQLKAEQGVKFLRTNYPDVDISADLLKEEIQKDENALKVFDPYQGNEVAQLVFLDRKQRSRDFIASPSGEIGSELNVYPIRGTDHRHSLNFIPISKPLINFKTPIRQLETFPRINITENCSVVDMNCGGISHTYGQLLLVNDIGTVSLVDTEGIIHHLPSPPDTLYDQEETPNRFWRIAWAGIDTYMRASTKQAYLFDSRAPNTPAAKIVHLNNRNEYLTSIEPISAQNTLLGFSTTTRLLLFDARNLTQPVISLNHHRSFDRTLRLKSFRTCDTMWHTLSSSHNRLVTVYSTICSSHGLIHLQGMPYILPSSLNIELPIKGSHIFQKSSNESGSPVSFLQLSSRDLWSTDIALLPTDDLDSGIKYLNPVRNDDMEELIKISEAMSRPSEDEELESTEVDMSAVYEKITQVEEEEEEPGPFYGILDGLSSFWQNVDTPIETMPTTFDVAFRLGQEPRGPIRADFLNGTALNSSRGLSALLQGRLPISELLESAPWSFDLASLPTTLVPDMAKPPQQLLDQLIEEGVNKETTSDGIKFAIKAAQELVMDLNLSRHVYAPRKFSQVHTESNTGDDVLEATQALFLDPAVQNSYQFTYFQPVVTREPEKTFELLPGVNLLLSEWKPGTKPEDYVFYDWYGSRNDPLPEREKSKDTKKPFEPSQSQPLRAPPVIASRPPPIATSQPTSGPSRSLYPIQKRMGGSQVDHMSHEGLSQEQYYPNTQPVPGIFGGQLNLNSRKTAKKRIGGF